MPKVTASTSTPKDVIDPQTDTVDFTDGLDLPDGWKGHDCGSVLETVVADLAAHSQYFYTVTAYAGGLTSLPSDEMAVYTERAGLDSAVTPAFFDVYTLTGTCVLRGATSSTGRNSLFQNVFSCLIAIFWEIIW